MKTCVHLFLFVFVFVFFSAQRVVVEEDKTERQNVWTILEKNLRIEIVAQVTNFHLIDTAILLSVRGGQRETGPR